MFKFVSLGSGSSGNSYFLLTDQVGILIDAGLGIRQLKRALKDRGFGIENVNAVFVTHDHADHIKSVGHLSNDFGLPIYSTQSVHMGITKNYCVTTKIPNDKVCFIQKQQTVTIGNLHVTAFDVPHDSTDCVGYRVQTDNGITFCLITDVGRVTPVIQEEVGIANYLVLESNHDKDMLLMGPYPAYLKGRIRSGRGHLDNVESARLVAESASPELKHVWLCHLSEENNHPELARKTYETVLREYGLIAGVDFVVDILRRKVPSEVCELV